MVEPSLPQKSFLKTPTPIKKEELFQNVDDSI